jgi:hypothetical protein
VSLWPEVDRDPVDLPMIAGVDAGLWGALIELSEISGVPWTLVGGQMVLLHALEAEVSMPRVTTDLDVLVNSRVVTRATRRFVEAIVDLGFDLVGSDPTGIAHRYRRGGVVVDVLAPEGLGGRSDLTTTPPGRTIMVPGGSQALERTEWLPVRVAGKISRVPRPSLLGAIVAKASAIGVSSDPDAQWSDLALLLGLVAEPGVLVRETTPKVSSSLGAPTRTAV